MALVHPAAYENALCDSHKRLLHTFLFFDAREIADRLFIFIRYAPPIYIDKNISQTLNGFA